MFTTVSMQCIDKTLQPVNLPKLTSGGREEVRVEFSFDDSWAGLGKTAIFYRDESLVYHALLVDNACTVPWGVMAKPGKLFVGVYGSSGETTRTSEVLTLHVAQGAITGASAMDPTPDVYQQILSEYGLLAARVSNLLAGGTAGDSELVDVRLGVDGKTYSTAGEAVREQARIAGAKADHVSAQTLGYIKREPAWSQGNFSGPINTRIVTDYFHAAGDVSLVVSDGYAAAVGIYSKVGDVYTLTLDTGWKTGTTDTLATAGAWYRVVVRREDEANITPDNTAAVVITEHANDSSLMHVMAQNTVNLAGLNFMFEPTRNIFTAAHAWENATIANGAWEDKVGINEYAAIKEYMPINANTDHVVSWANGNNTNLYISFYDDAHGYVSRLTFYNTGESGARTFTTPSGVSFFRVSAYKQGAADWRSVALYTMQIEQGTEPTAIVGGRILKPEYHNYQGFLTNATKEFGLDVLQRNALKSNTVRSIAHRGEPVNNPQCTAPSYIAAKKLGFAYAENDLMLSSDGVLVMWHDDDLARLGNLVDINGCEMYTDANEVYYYNATTGVLYTYGSNGYAVSSVDVASLTRMAGSEYGVSTLPLSVLKRIDFGVYKGEKFSGTSVLTFEEWVRLCKKLGMGIYIDKKVELTSGIIAEMYTTLRRFGMLAYTSWVVWSFAECELIRQHDPKARLVLIITPDESKIASFAPFLEHGSVSFYPQSTAVTAEMCDAVHATGYEMECWHVDYTSNGFNTVGAIHEETLRVIDCGVDGVALDLYTVEDAIQAFMAND